MFSCRLENFAFKFKGTYKNVLKGMKNKFTFN